MMRVFFLTVLLSLTLTSGTARAEPVPPEALAEYFKGCMGKETSESDHERAQYCQCIADEMQTWDSDTFSQALAEQSKTGDKATPRLEALAKTCIAKVLK